MPRAQRARPPTTTTILLLLLLLLALALASAQRVVLSNVAPRLDEDGEILRAGDGCISYEPGARRYYLFGANYACSAEPDDTCYCGPTPTGDCVPCFFPGDFPPDQCYGWRNMTYSAYSSADLVSWRKEGDNIMPVMTDAASPYSSARNAYFEPCGVFNRATGFWVLWFAHPFVKGSAVSRAPGGPFELVQWAAGPHSSDFYLWLDVATDALFMKHNGVDPRTSLNSEFVATLSPNYMAIAETGAGFAADKGFTEGGGIFVHNGGVRHGGLRVLFLSAGQQRLPLLVADAARQLHLSRRQGAAPAERLGGDAGAAVQRHARLHDVGRRANVHWSALRRRAGPPQVPRPAILGASLL